MYRILIIVCIMCLLSSCKKSEDIPAVIEIPIGNLELVSSFEIDVPEPSGLSFGPDNNTLLTVSDHTNQIYEMDLEGNIIRTLDYNGKDLEGITYNPDNHQIAVVEETDREVTFINYESGEMIETYKIIIPFGTDNSGLEGISYNANNRLYYIVNERNPELLICWSPDYDIISEDELAFATDYSGVFADSDKSLLWFVSDQSKSLVKCDYSANVLEEYYLDILKYEGVVVDNDLVYFVNDATAMLYIYQIVKK